MALPMTLVVLLVAGGMVAISFYFIENMMTTTKMKARDELRFNAAASGLERGKSWLLERIDDDEIPALIAAGSIASVTSSDNYKELLVAVSGDILTATKPHDRLYRRGCRHKSEHLRPGLRLYTWPQI